MSEAKRRVVAYNVVDPPQRFGQCDDCSEEGDLVGSIKVIVGEDDEQTAVVCGECATKALRDMLQDLP